MTQHTSLGSIQKNKRNCSVKQGNHGIELGLRLGTKAREGVRLGFPLGHSARIELGLKLSTREGLRLGLPLGH